MSSEQVMEVRFLPEAHYRKRFLARSIIFALIAQLAEHPALNGTIESSILSERTRINTLADRQEFKSLAVHCV